MEAYYVLQMKRHPWDDKHWDTLDGQHYRTVDEARAALGMEVGELYVTGQKGA